MGVTVTEQKTAAKHDFEACFDLRRAQWMFTVLQFEPRCRRSACKIFRATMVFNIKQQSV